MDGKGIIGWALEIEVETHEVKVDGSSIDFDIDIGSGGNIDIELAAVKNLKTSLEVFIGCELESTTNLSSYAKIVWVNSELADLRKEFGHLIDEKLGKNDLKTINGKSLIITDPNDTDIVIDQPELDLLNCNMTYELVDGQIVWSCDHTWDEIYTAIQDGKIVRLLVDGTTFMPFIIQNTAGAFSNSTHIELENNSTYEWNVSFTYDNGVWELHNELTPVFTSSDKTKLDSIEEGAQVNVQSDWNQIDSTADDFIKNKPIIPTVNNNTVTIQKNGTTVDSFTLNASSDKTINIEGVQDQITSVNKLSADLVKDGTTNKVFTSTEKTKLEGIEDGAEVNVQSDWNQSDTTSSDYIKNKPTIPSVPTIRTINGEQLTDSSLGDINIHDGFYFPNAVQDYDGNWYGAVVIGDQVWLGENLRTTHYADGTEIQEGTSTSTDMPYYYHANNNIDNDIIYGLLYNEPAFMRGVDFSNNNPSGVQGVSPNGWHIPSKSEFEELVGYVKNQKRYLADAQMANTIAKSLAATSGWNDSMVENAVGNNQAINNATGFDAKPAGNYGGSYASFGNHILLASTTEYSWATYTVFAILNSNSEPIFSTNYMFGAISVRCVSNLTPIQFRNWYIETYGSLQHHLPEEVQVQSDWDQTTITAPDYIKNKPSIPTIGLENFNNTDWDYVFTI